MGCDGRAHVSSASAAALRRRRLRTGFIVLVLRVPRIIERDAHARTHFEEVRQSPHGQIHVSHSYVFGHAHIPAAGPGRPPRAPS